MTRMATCSAPSQRFGQAVAGSMRRTLHMAIICCVVGPVPALAQGPVELHLCPTTIVRTCVIGYVSTASRLVIMLSSQDNDPLVGAEVDVVASPANASVSTLDLPMHIGSVVTLDAVATDRLYSAKLVSVADPLLTALYLSMYMQPIPAGVPPR